MRCPGPRVPLLVEEMDKEPAQQFRFEPRGFGGHDLAGIGHGHQLGERGGYREKATANSFESTMFFKAAMPRALPTNLILLSVLGS